MAAPFLPPPNLAGVALSPPPHNPVIYADIPPAVDYVRHLNGRLGHPATAHEVGIAECYKAALVFSAAAPAQIPAAPPWVQALQANVNQQFAAMSFAMFANWRLTFANWRLTFACYRHASRQAGNREPLYNPTVPGWVLLAPPHPTTRDELFVFTQAQCIESAGALGLQPLPQNTPVAIRRKQIAIKLGVTL